MIGQISKQQTADRPHDEADRKQDRGVQLLDDRIVTGKEGLGEIKCEGSVGVEVVPLDQIADRTDNDRPQPPADIGEGELIGRRCGSTHQLVVFNKSQA